MALDPEIQALLPKLAALKLEDMCDLSPAAAREASAEFSRNAPPGPDVAHVESRSIPGPAGAIPIRIYKPALPPTALITYFHGGGWMMGSLDSCDGLARTLVSRSGAALVSVDYRLAPEHRFPAAAEDAVAALRWSTDNRAALAGADAPLIVAGDSAGGNLAAVAALDARDTSGPQIALQLLFYPVIDADFDRVSYREHAEGPVLSRRTMIWFWDHYVPDIAHRRDPRVAPLHAGDLRGLPRALIQTAEYDPLRDEGEAYGARLAQAGVPTVVQRRAGLIHGYAGMSGAIKAASAAIDDAVAAIRSLRS